jgi:hypothetical protein
MAKMLVAAPVWIVTGAHISVLVRFVPSGARTSRDARDEVVRKRKARLLLPLHGTSARHVCQRAVTHEVETEHDGDDDIRECGKREPDDDHRLEFVELHKWTNDPALDGRRNPHDCARASKQAGGSATVRRGLPNETVAQAATTIVRKMLPVRSLIRHAKKSWTIHAMHACAAGQRTTGHSGSAARTVMAGSVVQQSVGWFSAASAALTSVEDCMDAHISRSASWRDHRSSTHPSRRP